MKVGAVDTYFPGDALEFLAIKVLGRFDGVTTSRRTATMEIAWAGLRFSRLGSINATIFGLMRRE